MKKSRWKAIVIPGVICVLLLIVSVWYSVEFNESRLVVPVDFKTYKFSPKDLPMLCSTVLLIIYIFFFDLYGEGRHTAKRNSHKNKSNSQT